MKKGLIMLDGNHNLIVLTPSGDFVQVKKKNNRDKVGDSVAIGLTKNMKISLIACAMAVVVGIISTVISLITVYNKPYTYVSIDINPAVEFTLNKKGQVLSVSSRNSEGDILIANEEFEDMSVEDASVKLVSLAVESGFLNLNTSLEYENSLISGYNSVEDVCSVNFNAVMVTVINEKDNVTHDIKVKTSENIKNYLSDSKIASLVFTRDGNYELREEAVKDNMSCGKLELISVLDGYVTSDEAFNMSVSELIDKVYSLHEDKYRGLDQLSLNISKQKLINKNCATVDYYMNLIKENEDVFNELSSKYSDIENEQLTTICNEWNTLYEFWHDTICINLIS